MNARKVVTGSVLAAGLGVAGLLGAAPAFAGPGISYNNGGDSVGFGDQELASGAYADADDGNNALAVSTGLTPGGATAIARGQGNNVVSIDGVSITGPNTKRNNVISVLGATTVTGDSHDNNVLTVGGVTAVDKAYSNTIVNAGGSVTATDQGKAPGAVSLSVCGTAIGAQADHITVDSFAEGLCGGED